MQLKTSEIVLFHRHVTDYYYQSGRHDMLWRRPDAENRFEPYKILVSEMMLQQTQVDRVTPKYVEFLGRFPAVQDLANAPLGEVLKTWNGLGYNRRAKYIWQTAQTVRSEYNGAFPVTSEELQRLPGIGPNTAGAILAYAYNESVVFVETNVRTVIIHHFFSGQKEVSDTAIREVMAKVVPGRAGEDVSSLQGAILGPREFYWALMDYGSHLKKTIGNVNRASKHYSKQSTFQGSQRQIRGAVIRALTERPMLVSELRKRIEDDRLDEVLAALAHDGLLVRDNKTLRLS